MHAKTDMQSLEKVNSLKGEVTPRSQVDLPSNESVWQQHSGFEDEFPEGGLRAWLVVTGGFCLSMSTFGYVNSFGAFQAYYEAGPLSGTSSSAISWIGSLQYSLIFLPGLLTGRLFDLGYFRATMASGTVLFVLANFLIAECQHYWQFLLCQGFAFGLANGWIFIPCVAAVSHWFKNKRPIAISVVSFGSSFGGVIYPIMFRNLLPHIGFKWTVRIIAFLNTAAFIVANLTMRTRLPPRGKRAMLDFGQFLTASYILYVLSTLIAFLGLYTFLIYLSVSAEAIGFTPFLSFYLVSVANGLSAVGRITSGFLALKYGPLNVMIILTTVTSLMTYIWPFITSHTAFIVVVAIYGFSSGAFIGLFPVPVTQLGSTDSVGERSGLQMTVMALGALGGPPISGAILDLNHSFHQVGIYAGTMIMSAVFMMIIARTVTLRRLMGGKL